MAIGWLLAAFVITLLLVRGAIAMHTDAACSISPDSVARTARPTRGGGGIGVVIALLICIPGALLSLPAPWPASVVISLAMAFALVAFVGWWDDHRPLPVLPRFGAQLLAVLGFPGSCWPRGCRGGGCRCCWGWRLEHQSAQFHGWHRWAAGAADHLRAAGLAWMSWSLAQPALACATAALAASAFGFWLYNRPPARIFMGDVGSGSIGLLIFAFSAMLWRLDHAMLWPLLILSSAFLLDAT
jgi:UDP-N-acetylmuramyl pentapeptide phosphotransferase/UDP-N-acetylglucosamine-1-phosphate transferase